MRQIAFVLLFYVAAMATQYPCQRHFDLSLLPPYEGTYCLDPNNPHIFWWLVSYTPKTKQIIVTPKFGKFKFVSAEPGLELRRKRGHRFILEIAPGIDKEHIHVDFWGAGWK